MEISDLYTLAAQHHHEIHSCELCESPSFAVEEHGKCYIAMSNKLSDEEEKTYLAHELGHCEYGGFYNYYSHFTVRSRAEARANKWAYIHVLPLTEIEKAIRSGCENTWELAEYFQVTEEFMREALTFYADCFETYAKAK